MVGGTEMTARPERACICGHAMPAHEHYRAGSDCGVCGSVVCPRFRPQRFGRGALFRRPTTTATGGFVEDRRPADTT